MIYYLRHFKTENNTHNVLSGQSIAIPICESHDIVTNIHFNKIYCSTALRCKQTIAVFLKNHNIDNIEYTDIILERDLGNFEGKDKSIFVEYPDNFINEKLNLFKTPPMGESYNNFYLRAKLFSDILCETPNSDILICSHNQFLRLLYLILQNKMITQQNWNSLKFPFGKIVTEPLNLDKI